jgi:hypothetical protein
MLGQNLSTSMAGPKRRDPEMAISEMTADQFRVEETL